MSPAAAIGASTTPEGAPTAETNPSESQAKVKILKPVHLHALGDYMECMRTVKNKIEYKSMVPDY